MTLVVRLLEDGDQGLLGRVAPPAHQAIAGCSLVSTARPEVEQLLACSHLRSPGRPLLPSKASARQPP